MKKQSRVFHASITVFGTATSAASLTRPLVKIVQYFHFSDLTSYRWDAFLSICDITFNIVTIFCQITIALYVIKKRRNLASCFFQYSELFILSLRSLVDYSDRSFDPFSFFPTYFYFPDSHQLFFLIYCLKFTFHSCTFRYSSSS